uniref:Uncharacterized protein n=1 Tax=Setaria digitata TaxID=48799 RepID=A0A915PKH7_9BILA
MHSESAIFQHRLAAGASIIAQKKARFKKKNQKHIRMNSDAVKQIIGNSVYNNSESKQFVNFSSYDISNNSETSIPSALWKRKHLEKANKLEEIQKSENVEKLSGIIAAEKKEIESEQVLIKQNLSEIERVVEDLYKNRCFVSRSAAPSYLSAQLYGSPKMEKRKYPRLRDKL